MRMGLRGGCKGSAIEREVKRKRRV